MCHNVTPVRRSATRSSVASNVIRMNTPATTARSPACSAPSLDPAGPACRIATSCLAWDLSVAVASVAVGVAGLMIVLVFTQLHGGAEQVQGAGLRIIVLQQVSHGQAGQRDEGDTGDSGRAHRRFVDRHSLL